ncbi:hypothetical protein E5288_WYG002671 [Bos mutus]|uniref:Vacuolar protein sorting-associated protein 13A n=1 Tax=Bos mutus TaxID=72004 RepID=A0A6B0S0H7_9CETA|nr:hypothetical protein [Bos mutus]
MVFESVVVDVLNRFLGDYVVNLDTSQLSLGIWAGAVALKNLEIKENALSQLDVPFKIKVGHIGTLNLIIPWKNLYTQPVEAVLEGVYLLIVPSSRIKYDPIKEEKQLFEAKQQELKRIEEAKRKVADQEKQLVEKQDTFTEKLITQIIKNLQVKISNIHIRYEDDVTNRENPLSFGISLQNLSMQTTDQYWIPCLHDETEKLFRKLIRLDNLFAYWNVKTQLFYLSNYDESVSSLRNGIVDENIVPEGYDFVFRPISANAKLQMNRRSDFDFSAPKIDLDVELHDITIQLNKPQYFSFMELLESVDMMTQNVPYRKFKPDVPLRYHAKEWWAYAIHGILEVNIRPHLRMWSWKHIREHRQKMKQYKELYKKKLTSKKPSGELLNSLEDLEKTLDVFNITVARQQAEVEVKKAGYRIFREGAEESEGNKGWFSWMWSWSESHSKQQLDIKPGSLEEILTPKEKSLLYEAIGYSETAVDPTLPKTFEAMKFFVHLKSMSIILREQQQKPELLDIVVEEFSTLIVQRPGAQAVKFETKIDSFHVTGLPDNSTKPRLLSSLDDAASLLKIMFEINPLDETVAQRCIIEAEPLEMLYDARTVNSIVEFFRPPKEVNLAQLTSVTLTKLEEFRDKTATGLVYIIETQKVLDLKINLNASYIIIPQDGIFSPTSNLLLLDLGHLKVTSKIRSELPDLKQGGANREEIMHRAYDSFDIQLTSIQLLFSRVGDNWKEARKLNVSAQHILVPMHFNVELSKAMVFMDISMPKFKIYGNLPLISLRISDKKLQGILELIESIPKPSPATEVNVPVKSSQSTTHFQLIQIRLKDSDEEFFDAPCSPLEEPLQSPSRIKSPQQKNLQKPDCFKNMIEYKIRFEVPEVLIQFCHLVGDCELPVVEINVLGLGTDIELRTFDLKANAFLKEVCLKCPDYFALKSSKNEDTITLQILAELSCLQIFIQDQKRNISEIKIEGLDCEIIMRPSVTETNAKLRNIIVLDSDITAVYKKAVYITGKEVFSFKMVSYMGATAGSAYTDMNVVDMQVNLTVGCIEVVLVKKFLYSILAFIDNFQAGKQALAEATVQAAGMAATGVKELAQRSSRMALDVHIKAPVVVIPQSPVSENIFVADFGLITMKNTFHVITKSPTNPPPIIDLITIKLSEMRLYSQEDITTIFKTLYGNIWYEGDSASHEVTKDQSSVTSGATTASHHAAGTTVVTAAVVEVHSHASQVKTTLNMSFRTDYLTMVLYSPGPKQTSFTDIRDPSLKLAEFKLENIISTLKMYTDDSILSSFSLKNCILDDKRPHIKKATPRMIGLTVGFDKKDMMDVRYRTIRDGWVADIVLQEMYICASVEFLLTVANVFLEAYTTGTAVETNVQTWSAKEEVPKQQSEKWEMNITIKNPEIVFVADMTRNDAPALVITTQCEIYWLGDFENDTMTAAIKDLQVRACPFLPVKRKGKITTVLQPCDLFCQATQISTDPQVLELSVKSLTLKVSPVIINTVITITSALYTAKETIPKETASSTAHLWEKKDTKDLNMWFLEEPNEAVKRAPMPELVPKGEIIKMNIDSIFLVLEAGIGHRTVPMLLAKSRFSGEGKNWSSLINLHCQLELEVHYYNEMFGVWEPLLEPLEIDQTEDFRPWNLGIKMKKKAKKAIVESGTEEENYRVPEYKTVITFYSKDQLNITLSKCGLIMLNNLAEAFTEAATGSSATFIRDLAPFMILNSLGLSISVSPSESFSVLNVPMAKSYVLKNEESLSMDYMRTKDNDHFNAMTSLSSKHFFILLTPANHSTADKIPLTKVGRRLYTVRHRESGVERSIVCQIDAVEGSKKVTVRSPVQIRNHFSIPLSVYGGDTLLGTASPGSEFNIPLASYRSLLSLKPEDADYQMCEGIDFEEIIKQDGTSFKKKCRPINPSRKPFIINIVPEKDNLTYMSVYSEDRWDLPYIIHLWPPILLRNLLPYKIAYYIEGIEHRVFTLHEGRSAQLCTVQLDKARLHLKLLDYLNHDWKSEYHIKPNQQDISFISFTCVTEIEKTDLDIAVHVTYNTGQTIMAFHSPYWMVNKTGRMLQYKADGIHRKHPPNYKKPVLFSFQPKHFFNNNKVQLMVTDSELSDQFSIDTVGSHGAVKCKGPKMEYQVGVTIDLSSFNITRIVTFTPFFLIKNKSKYHISVAEEGNDKWLALDLEQCVPFWPEDASNKLLIRVERSESPPHKIHFNKEESCILLRLDNELGGIIAEVNLAEHSTVITFSDYRDGAATFLLINHTKNDIVQYKQSSLSEIEDSLPPGKAVFYTWADPVGSRKLQWKCGKSHGEVTQKDDMMTPINLGKTTIYLVSFFEGLQRIILFTEDPRVFKVTYESEKAELAEQEIVLALQDVGISLVNNYTKQEVAYIGITSDTNQRYFKVLIQEMDLRLDLGFVYAVSELMTPAEVTEKTEVELFHKDIEAFQEEYKIVSLVDSSQVSLYEYFHISPIKVYQKNWIELNNIHYIVGFKIFKGGEEPKDSEQHEGLMAIRSLHLLLKSIGATLTDVQDVVFKLAFFELNYQFHTTAELQSEVIRHYSKQAIKQMYVLILGLDVLGNPFGLIREFSEGVEAFFYEPYQGAIQGPEEFVEGMALGLKALVGGAVGGLAGAASKITSAMAKGVAAMTMDEDYQQKRREAMNKQPAGLREGITRGGKGLVSGFVSGITGIVTKPIKGAQKEGATGFFKGVGKGLVGAVTRPTGGIIDMASSTFQGIKRATETSDEVESLRPPRFFNEDGVIRPYRLRDGTGNQMLQVMENGRFAKYKYFTHVMINKTDMLMITRSGVLFVTKGTFGQLTCEWQYSFDEFTKEPFIVHERRLRIEAKERVKSVFHAKEFGKIVNFRTPEDARVNIVNLLLKHVAAAHSKPSPRLCLPASENFQRLISKEQNYQSTMSSKKHNPVLMAKWYILSLLRKAQHTWFKQEICGSHQRGYSTSVKQFGLLAVS